MSLYQKMLVFYAVMAVITAIITWFLSRDKKRIRFLSAVLVGATWPMSFPRCADVFSFLMTAYTPFQEKSRASNRFLSVSETSCGC